MPHLANPVLSLLSVDDFRTNRAERGPSEGSVMIHFHIGYKVHFLKKRAIIFPFYCFPPFPSYPATRHNKCRSALLSGEGTFYSLGGL